MSRRRAFLTSCFASLALASLVTMLPSGALAEDDYFAGKTVTIIIPIGPGGAYDTYARLVARHLGRHIPGNPTVIAQNMPGAGSLRSANFLYNVAAKDGTVIGHFSRGLA